MLMAIDTNIVLAAEDALQLEMPKVELRGNLGGHCGPTMYVTHTKQLLLSDIIS